MLIEKDNQTHQLPGAVVALRFCDRIPEAEEWPGRSYLARGGHAPLTVDGDGFTRPLDQVLAGKVAL